MKRTSIIGLALLAVTAISAIASSSAFAVCELTLGYCVLGKPLGAGESREIDAAARTEFVLKGEVLTIPSVTKCKQLKLNHNQHPVIIGGMPGTGAGQLIEFSECSATVNNEPCGGVVVHNVPTTTEQVHVVLPATLKNRLATLFRPTNGSTFTTILLKECPIVGTTEATVTGTTAALDNPVLTEQPHGTLIWTEAQQIKEVSKLDGKKEPVGLIFAGNAATLNGEALVLLVSKEPWGVFN